MTERKYRTSEEVTRDILIERLDIGKLVSLLEQDAFQDYHLQIAEKLQTVNDLHLDTFKKVHSSVDCHIEENETEFDVRTKGYGKRNIMIPLMVRTCTEHGVSSNTFIDWQGDIREGSFYAYRRKRE